MSDRHANAEGLASAVTSLASLEVINERLAKAGLPAMEDQTAGALALVKASGIKSQGEATVLIVNLTGGRCTAEQVTVALKAAFPTAKIGTRHGPHYLSLARTGKLEGVETSTIPHAARKAKKASVAVPAASASTPATPAPVVSPTPVPAAPAAPAIDVDALRAELDALPQKDLATRAKAVGVKAMGKKTAIIDAIVAAS